MARAARPRKIEALGVDHPCHKCGYNLRGLIPGAACPECGTPMRLPSVRRLNDTLADAPPPYLRVVCAGLTLMAVGGVGLGIAMLYARGPWRYYGSAWAALTATSWVIGVWLITRRRMFGPGVIRDVALDHPAFRWTIRWSQLLWLVTAGGLVMVAFLPLIAPPAGPAPGIPAPPSTPVPGVAGFRLLANLGMVGGLLALAPLGVFLVSFAGWAGDTGVAERLRVSVWGIIVGAFGGFIAGAVSPLTGNLAGLFQIAAMFGWGSALVAALLLIASVVQLAHLAWWAVRNNAEQGEVQTRLARRRARHEQEMSARSKAAVEAMKNATGPSPIAPGARVRVRAYDENSLPRPPAVKPYPLEPEE